MTKLKLEFIRLGLTFFVFIFIISLLFTHINQIKTQWAETVGELLIIPIFLLIIGIPVWLIVDLTRKKVIDKAIFNLTFFISIISILLLFFAFKFLR